MEKKIEITHRVTYKGKNFKGEPESGAIDIKVPCDPKIKIEDLVAAVRVAAQRKLQNEGYYEVFLGSMYKQRPHRAVNP